MSTVHDLVGTPANEVSGDAVISSFTALCAELDLPFGETEIRAKVPLSDRGADASTLRYLADCLDLSFEAIKPSSKCLETLATPFLIIGEEGDAWLARGRADRHLMLVDGERGATKAVTPRTAAELATTIVVLRRRPRKAVGQGLWQRVVISRLRPALLEIVTASVFINLMALATPIFMMTVYNKVINHAAVQTLDVLAIGMISLFAFEMLLRGLRGYVVGHTGAKLDLAISREVVHHLLALPGRVFENMPSGQLLERLRQLDQLRQFLTGNMPMLLVDLAFVGLFLAATFFLSPTLGWVTAAAMPCFILVSALAHRRQKSLVKQSFRAVAGKSSAIAEIVANAHTIKALGLESEMERRFEKCQVESAWTAHKAASVASLVGSGGQVLQQITGLVVIYLGALQIIEGQLTIGALVACTILSARALAPMRQLFFAWHQLQQVRDGFARLDELMNEKAERRGTDRPAPPQISGHIRLDKVDFRYAEDKPLAVHGIDLDIAPGTMLAVIGAPGSGKSTLAKLIAGLETASQGRVLIDGEDLTQISLPGYRSQIGIVPQEIQLFTGTIAENIAMASPERSFARVVAAAKFVGLHEIVEQLPDGYETQLGERGVGLSVGQRQLVCIARAVVRNPRLLILDEATSALDVVSERLLLRNLHRAGRGRTIIVVTHRRSVAEVCDCAALMQGGRLAHVGDPGELIALAEHSTRQRPVEAAHA